MGLSQKLAEAYRVFCKGVSGPLWTRGEADPREAMQVLWVRFSSQGGNYLLDEDKKIQENLNFNIPVFLPNGSRASECLILGHGFNESDYAKLFPWAYCLCQDLSIPVIIFPSSFHINRRPGRWIREGRGLYHLRKRIPGNRSSSPLNAIVSQRLSERPERFFRGALQSYTDLKWLLRYIRCGTIKAGPQRDFIEPFCQDTVAHFLGYSVSGYLFLGAILMDQEGLTEESRLILFNSFTAWEEAHPVTPLVIDQDAYDRGTRFYLETFKAEGSKDFLHLYEETKEGNWFRRLFLKHTADPPLREEVSKLSERILIIADPDDLIFPGRAIGRHLGEGIATAFLTMGRHEFPFNIPKGEDLGIFELTRAIRKSYVPSDQYWDVFSNWLRLVATFLKSFGQDHAFLTHRRS